MPELVVPGLIGLLSPSKTPFWKKIEFETLFQRLSNFFAFEMVQIRNRIS
jgi:hypothetical protein